MMFLKLAVNLQVLLALSSAMIVDRKAPAHGEMSILAVTPGSNVRASQFVSPKSACEKEDEDDCTEFCKLSAQTATCVAAGNKITCSCKGGKSESNCEERCLLCMPDKSAFEEVSHLFKHGQSKKKDH